MNRLFHAVTRLLRVRSCDLPFAQKSHWRQCWWFSLQMPSSLCVVNGSHWAPWDYSCVWVTTDESKRSKIRSSLGTANLKENLPRSVARLRQSNSASKMLPRKGNVVQFGTIFKACHSSKHQLIIQAWLLGGAFSHHSTWAKIILHHETQLASWLFGGFFGIEAISLIWEIRKKKKSKLN